MYLCSQQHEEICYNGAGCPLCTEIERRETAEERVNESENEVEDLNGQVEDLQYELNEGKGQRVT